MKMDIVAGSGNDEFYTPKYAILPLLKYIKPPKVIWCPFDTKDSNFVKVLENTFTVIPTHKDTGNDFFTTTIPCDVIISNPPYSQKYNVFKRLFSLGTPFAMLVGIVGLFESQERFRLFKENNFEIMYFNRRISYFADLTDDKPLVHPPFSSVYITSGLLPNTIVFEEVTKGS